jgi:hypothetical protein
LRSTAVAALVALASFAIAGASGATTLTFSDIVSKQPSIAGGDSFDCGTLDHDPCITAAGPWLPEEPSAPWEFRLPPRKQFSTPAEPRFRALPGACRRLHESSRKHLICKEKFFLSAGHTDGTAVAFSPMHLKL